MLIQGKALVLFVGPAALLAVAAGGPGSAARAVQSGPVGDAQAVMRGELPPAVLAAGEAIVVDHTSTDLDAIPAEWLSRARALTLHYAHTSHGSQIVSGIEKLAQVSPQYGVAVRTGGEAALPAGDGVLRIYDGNNPDTYITPELYWSDPAGLAKTRATASTGLFDFSMWSWCGQQSSNATATVQQYLDTMDALESEYPDMRFILMTGHTDGGGDELARNNQMVRDYAQRKGKVLFDFADIETYDPAGNQYPQTSDACAWCTDWCAAHPEDCTDLPSDCAHSHPFNCKLKGRAFWWMMSRLAGWAGPGVAPSPTTPVPAPTATDAATAPLPSETPSAPEPTPTAPTPTVPETASPPAYRVFLPWADGS
jgi:hypothetical protein